MPWDSSDCNYVISGEMLPNIVYYIHVARLSLHSALLVVHDPTSCDNKDAFSVFKPFVWPA